MHLEICLFIFLLRVGWEDWCHSCLHKKYKARPNNQHSICKHNPPTSTFKDLTNFMVKHSKSKIINRIWDIRNNLYVLCCWDTYRSKHANQLTRSCLAVPLCTRRGDSLIVQVRPPEVGPPLRRPPEPAVSSSSPESVLVSKSRRCSFLCHQTGHCHSLRLCLVPVWLCSLRGSRAWFCARLWPWCPFPAESSPGPETLEAPVLTV